MQQDIKSLEPQASQEHSNHRSPTIGLLAGALCKAQAAFLPPKKDSFNPHFKSTYADLASDWEACRKPLTDNGLVVIQTTHLAGPQMVLRTTLLHTSGEFISGDYILSPQKNDPQGLKGAVTYARRAALEAIVGLASEDDDGNAAAQPKKPQQQVQGPTPRRDGKPAQADYPKANPNWEKEPATDAQRKRLFAMAKEAGYDEVQLKDVMFTMTKKESTKDLTKGEIQTLFKEFEGFLSAVKTA